jgi:hypothetical protein
MVSRMFTVANCSSTRQVRWTDCIVPNDAAESLPDQGILDGVLFQKGASRPCGTTFYVLADLAGNEVKTCRKDKLVAGTFTPAISKLTPDPTGLSLELAVNEDRVKFAVARTEGFGTHRWRFHLRATLKGFHADLWATVYSYQDIVDLCGRITWSDPTDPNHSHFTADDRVAILCHLGQFHLDYQPAWGQICHGYEIQPFNGTWPDAMSFPFYGHWQPYYNQSEDPNDPFGEFWSVRKQTAQAAKEGPILALWSDWDGNWFATKTTSNHSSYVSGLYAPLWEQFKARMAIEGKIYYPRLLASPLNTGQTGDQVAFCLRKDHVLHTSNDPRRIYELRESAVDYLLRCHHNFDSSGQPVRFDDHPTLSTWHLAKFRAPGSTREDLLGKASPTPGDGHAFGRPFVDDEHRADAFIACVRHVTDDPLLEADLYDRTQMDLARAFRANKWIPTPRASGRLFQSWAMSWWTTANEAMRAELHRLSVEEFQLRETHLQTPTGLIPREELGPVRPANVIATDSRVIDGGPAWVPWNDACLLVGLWHQIALWSGKGDDENLAKRMTQYWIEVAETILRWGTVRTGDHLLPCNGVLWLPNGEANSEDYYKFPRAGASFGDDAYDMLVGQDGWFTTMGWPTVVSGYLKIGQDEECRAIAKQIWAQCYQGMETSKLREWLV